MDEIVVHPYDWKTATDPETGFTTINCWALDKNSTPHLLRIHEFDAFCYVELPLFLNNSFVSWTQYRQNIVYEAICNILCEDRPYRYRFEMKEKIYFYKGKNKKYPMFLLCFRSISSMKSCKNKLKKAFKVWGLRGGEKKNDEIMIALRVWETHIPLERKMLTLRNCKYCQWFNIKGVKVQGSDKISTLEHEYVVDWKTLNPIPLDDTVSWITHPGILSFDLETYSDRHNSMPDSLCSKHVIYLVSVVYQKFLKPETRKKEIVLFGDCSDTDLANVIKVKTEMELIDTLQALILKYNPEIISGYNIFGYDFGFLENRLKRRMKEWKPLGRLIGDPSTMSTISWSSSAYKNQDFSILEMSGRICIDLLPLVKRDYKLPLYKLDYVAKYFLGKGKYDVTPQQMFEIYELQKYLSVNYVYKPEEDLPKSFYKNYKKVNNIEVKDGNEDPELKEKMRNEWQKTYKTFALDEMKKVVDYCVVDSDLVVDLFDKINVWIGIVQLSNIMGVVPADIFTRGTGVRMQSQVYDEASRSGIVLDEYDFPKADIEGGFVFDPAPGIYYNIPVLDFKSLYPSIQISHNLDHTSLLNPQQMDLVPDEECHVIEWDDELDIEESDSEDENDDEEKEKKPKIKKTVHRKYKFLKEPIGIMPRLLTRLIAERNKVRSKQKSVAKGSLEWTVLEQTQLGIKCSTNAYYGACASSFSLLKNPIIAECITAKARASTKGMNAVLVSKGYKIVYGDSVTSDTPILLRLTHSNGEQEIFLRPISRMKEGMQMWAKYDDSGKEYNMNFGNLEVWSDKGFTKIKHVMRHKTQKRIFRITAHTGVVKVTEDHSLLDEKANEIRPNELHLNDKLLTKSMPEISDQGIEIPEAWAWGIFYGDGSCGYYDCESGKKASWAINNLNLDFLNNAKYILEMRYPHLKFNILDTVESSGVYKLVPSGKGIKKLVLEWRNLFYDPDTKYKKIPDIIWKTSKETRINFYDGYYSADGDKDANGYNRFDNKGQIGAAGLFLLSRSLGFKVSCNTRSDKMDIYRMTCTKNSQRKHPGIVKKIEDLGIIDDYVYDLETENHHFSAGVGELVVHNTDSTMPDVGITDPKQAKKIGHELAKELSALYPKPMEIEFECTYATMLCIKKKMYICILLDDDGNAIEDPDAMKIRGVTLARRDNCKFQRDFYKSIVWKILHDHEKFINVFNFIVDKCLELLQRQIPWEELTMIKGLGSNYKSASYMMNIFAQEMQKSGNPLVPGDRITYLLVKTTDDIKDETKVGYKMRTPELYNERAESENPEHIDYMYYLDKIICNGIQRQLYQVGYKKELDEIEKKYIEMDQNRFFAEVLKKILSLDYGNPELQKMRIQGYNHFLNGLLAKFEGNKEKVIEHLLEDESFVKIAKPIYSYIIKRRKGRGKRLSSRIDREPITMMVRIARAKAEVCKSIREYTPKPKIIQNPIQTPIQTPIQSKKLVLKIMK
jgi:DNA polymerase elongation subunit (family B)